MELHFKVSVHSGGGVKAAGACEGGHIMSQSGTKIGGCCYAPHFFISCSPGYPDKGIVSPTVTMTLLTSAKLIKITPPH